MKLKQKLSGNKGLTLLEVLVSVFILAVVAAPLLNIFVTNTAMLRRSYEKTKDTYDAKSLMESFYGLPYDQLYAKSTVSASGVVTIATDAATGRYYSLTIKPAGPYVAGTTSFYHLIIKDDGSGWFAKPDGTLSTVAASSLAALAPSFEGGSPLLIANTRCVSTTMNLTLATGVSCLLYTPKNAPASKYKITPSAAVQVYNFTAPPATMLLDCVLKTYKANDASTQDGVFQTTMEVSLP